MTKESFGELVNAIHQSGCICMSTPFDETSVLGDCPCFRFALV
jgi:sialic acid synthase SpsE